MGLWKWALGVVAGEYTEEMLKRDLGNKKMTRLGAYCVWVVKKEKVIKKDTLGFLLEFPYENTVSSLEQWTQG